jgi:GT2 family glycosyltransferase
LTPIPLPRVEDPEVSVVIIAWRLEHALVDAVASIVDQVDAPSYEVIVVFNGAEPAVIERFSADVSGAVAIDLGYNTGYGYACNRAALSARGAFLVFLNDDAIAHPRMLAALVESARSGLTPERPAGIVAAVLVGPDGIVQEAGSRVLATAGTVQFGAGLSEEAASEAGYLTRRAIDYGSGAALLVRRDAFIEAGGYDARFEPAYYEDVDLAFRLRASGYDVILEPTARAVHVAGTSTDGLRRFRRFAGENAGRAFIDRWRDTLETAPSEDAPLDEICSVRPPQGESIVAPLSTEMRSPAEVALSISTKYASWLDAALDDCDDVRLRLATERDAARAEAARSTRLADERGRIAHEFKTRLDDLEHRNIVGIARWRIGAMVRRRESRRGA